MKTTATKRILSAALSLALLLTALSGLSLPVLAAGDDVCSIGTSSYTTLTEALADVNAGDIVTIKLLQNINYTDSVFLYSGTEITFDLNGKTLDITVDSGEALNVADGAVVDITGGGALNVTSRGGNGVVVQNVNSRATVTNATGNGLGSIGALALNGGTITVQGYVKANGTESKGAYASGGGTITVQGNVTASGVGSVGAYAQNGSTITIDGTVSGVYYIKFWDNGSSENIYKTQSDYITPTTKEGYHTYTHTDSDGTSGTSTIWVKDDGTGTNPSTIEVSTPQELNDAINGMQAGDTLTIKLLQNINHTDNVYLYSGKKITFDLNGKTLDITVNSGEALNVSDGAVVDITGTGALNVTSQDGDGVLVQEANSKATVTNAAGNGVESYGAFALKGGTLTVQGNVTASGEASIGAVAFVGGTITVQGNATASGEGSIGAYAAGGGTITIDGTVSGAHYIGFGDTGFNEYIYKTQSNYITPTTKTGYRTYTHTDSDGTSGTSTVWVKDDGTGGGTDPSTIEVSTPQELAAAINGMQDGGTLTIKLLQDINYTDNVYLYSGKKITFDLNGKTLDITVNSGEALNVADGAVVDITGTGALNVTSQDGDGVLVQEANSKATVTNAAGNGVESYGAFALKGGTLTVQGNVTASGEASIGAVAFVGGTITVQGNATASGEGSVGAVAFIGGTITINGTVSGAHYIGFYDTGLENTIYKTQSDYITPTTKEGYRTYTHTDSDPDVGTSTVWVKIPGSSIHNNSSSSSSSGSSGGSHTPSTSTSTFNATKWLETAEVKTLATAAKDKGESVVRTRSTGSYGARKAALAALAGLQYQHDTIADKVVQLRVSILHPDKAAADLMLSGSIKGGEVTRIADFFTKWFTNKVRVIHFDQSAAWGQAVQVAAKVELSGMDTTSLVLYSYDRKTNRYNRIEKPAYWVDSNGYLHFTTELAGDIIVSNGALVRK